MCSKYVSVVAMMNVIPPITLTKYESFAQIKEPKKSEKGHSFIFPPSPHIWKNITLKNLPEVDPDRMLGKFPHLV